MNILSRMVEQFEARHGCKPDRIVVAPVAMLALGLRKSLNPVWNGVKVEGRLFEMSEAVKTGGTRLGVFVKNDGKEIRLVACDLQ